MAQKFIITRRGILRMGNVAMHRDLLQTGDVCMGGGFYQFDPIGTRLLLSGSSYDFGAPMWDWLMDSGQTLKVPHAYQGLRVVYTPDDPDAEPLGISEMFQIEAI